MRLLLGLCLTLSICACTTPSGRLERLFDTLRDDVAAADDLMGPEEEITERNAQRAEQVREILEKADELSALDRFHAAALLVQTDVESDLDLAAKLAMEAGEMGEPRGLRVAAEAIDKRAMVRRQMQVYGTQYVFERVLESWRLYPVDPKTTDAERARMGVPTYAELLRAEDELNKSQGTKLRPR